MHPLLHCLLQGQDHSTRAAAATPAQAATLQEDTTGSPNMQAPPNVANLRDPARTGAGGSGPAGTGNGNSLLDDVDALLADAAALSLRGRAAAAPPPYPSATAASHADPMGDSVHDELGGFVLDDDECMEAQGGSGGGEAGGRRRLSSGGRNGGGSSSVGGVVEDGGAVQEVVTEEVFEYQVCC